MTNEMQKLLDKEDNENIELQGKKLNKIKSKINKRQFEKEIIMADNKKLDQIHADFENDNKLSFEESLLVQKVFAYIKSK